MRRAEYKVLEAHDAKTLEVEIYKLNNTPQGPVAWKPILMSSAAVGNFIRTTVILERVIDGSPNEITEEDVRRLTEISQIVDKVKGAK